MNVFFKCIKKFTGKRGGKWASKTSAIRPEEARGPPRLSQPCIRFSRSLTKEEWACANGDINCKRIEHSSGSSLPTSSRKYYRKIIVNEK